MHAAIANIVEDSTEFEFETAIYYGDSSVNLGEPFSITCIIPVTDPIIWLKDDEPITRHNLRHGRDEHSYILSESAIEGAQLRKVPVFANPVAIHGYQDDKTTRLWTENIPIQFCTSLKLSKCSSAQPYAIDSSEKHKIEAHISVRHALKVHEGRYQCNDLHTSYHMLYVNIPAPEAPKMQTKSPFVIHAPAGSGDANVVRHLSTEPIYETVHDLTPSNSDENLDQIFTRTWEPVDPGTPSQILPLPTQATMTTAILTQQQQQQHHRTHHHHHQLPTSQQLDRDDKHKLIYINATNFDGIPRPIDERRFDKSSGLINLQFNPAMDTRYTTEPWKGSTIYYAATPPNIPPPRTTALVIANIEHPQGQQYPGGIYPYKPNVVDSRHKSHDIHHTTALGEGVIKSQYPIQTVQAPPYYQYPTQQQLNTMVTFPAHTPPPQPAQHQPTLSIYQNPFLQYNQMPPGHMQPVQPIQPIQPIQTNYMTLPPGERVVATTAPIFASSTSYGLLPTSHTPPLMISNNMNNNNSNVNLLLTQTKSKERDFLVPNYDNAEHQLKVYEIRNPLVLSCNITKEGSYELK
uniref:Ig-like domain-containing protein n=1 Tax=Glossina pallidipes TaxID=7398 RepID=A0A1A9ZEU1_GLOPL